MRTIPGVERAGLISFLPPETRAGVFMGLAIDGVPPPERGAPARVINTLISSDGYFATMRMSVAAGRDFTDARHRPRARRSSSSTKRSCGGTFPNGDAMGRRIGTGFDGMKPVARNRRRGHATRTTAGWRPSPSRRSTSRSRSSRCPTASIALRTQVTPESVIPVIRDRLNRLNASVPLTDFQTLDERINNSLREPRFYTLMAAACASMAVLFVTFGLYGLVSYSGLPANRGAGHPHRRGRAAFDDPADGAAPGAAHVGGRRGARPRACGCSPRGR